MKYYMLTAILLMISGWLPAQDPGQVQSNCQRELSEINGKMTTLNVEYENIKKDLQAGLYCSLCNESKTELDKTYSGGFYKHVADVKGEVKPATPEQMSKAHDHYLQKFNSLKSQYESRQKSCNDNYNRAVESQNHQRDQEWQQAQQKQQEQTRQAQQKAGQERQAEESRRQELERQNETERQRIIAVSEKSKEEARQMFTDASNRLKNAISNIDMPSDKLGFDKNAGSANMGNGIDNIKAKATSVDDYDVDFETNNYLEQYGEQAQVLAVKEAYSSLLPEIVSKGFDQVRKFFNYGQAAADMTNGQITSSTIKSVFSFTPNAVIREIQKYSGGVTVKNANTVTGVFEKLFDENLSESDRDQNFNDAVNQMDPLYIKATVVRKERTMKDYVKAGAFVVGGGIALSAGLPVWLGVGAAAWYGFNF